MNQKIPFLRPNPPKLSGLLDKLLEIEASNIFSNYGPVNTLLEKSLLHQMFGDTGACLTVCNATIGLMLAIRHMLGVKPDRSRRFALIPSFTFAATGHAAIWAGLTPLLYDIEPDTWLPSATAEEELISRYGNEIAVIVPYATFGNNLDLERYKTLSIKHNIPVVIDAAASLGSLNDDGTTFGSGFSQPVVYSMHATKTFATSEAGLVYCADSATVEKLRAMGNFGFSQPRSATIPGLNSKLSEVGALLALEKLRGFDRMVSHRLELVKMYEQLLPEWRFQRRVGRSDAYQFVSVLPPATHANHREHILAQLSVEGIGFGRYFDPHLAAQPYFRETSVSGVLNETERVVRQIISLPLSDSMTTTDVERVCEVLNRSLSIS